MCACRICLQCRLISISFQHLALLLIVQQAIGQIGEALVPYLMYKRNKKHIKDHFCQDHKSSCIPTPTEAGVEKVVEAEEVDEHVLLQAQIESSKPTYVVCIQKERVCG